MESLILLRKFWVKRLVYDRFTTCFFQAGYYDEMVTLIRNLFGNALKTNNDLYFVIIACCLRISKESIFTGLNNLKINTITNAMFNEYFGFMDTDPAMVTVTF